MVVKQMEKDMADEPRISKLAILSVVLGISSSLFFVLTKTPVGMTDVAAN